MNEIKDYEIKDNVLHFECVIDAILDHHKASILSKEHQAVIEENKSLKLQSDNLKRQIEEQHKKILEYQKNLEAMQNLCFAIA
jgi:regulator of replication initiation timing